ncbi:YckD family protein [Aquibacillus koreensis]|uniref:YckD family protein n=1 Tax=Aquibacillus koreensis TaxID=279446 RepID=A0A9X3WJ05_9BACI|nr:YckD family protein [Aquibacillus koreensis]MCT2538144.1 YckD family protein [Aquibacillus koreensis]MDC3420912.1 YckD family protein [Aquibacillus koreensis]
MKNLMKKMLVGLFALTIVTVGANSIQAEKDHHHKPEFKEVELTDAQVKELATMYEDVLNQRIGVINKYQELGVLSEKDATMMKEHLAKFHEKLKEDNYIPKWDKHHKKDD